MYKNEERRTTRFVDPPTQTRIVLGLTIVPMSVLIVAAVVMWISAERLFDEAEVSDAAMPSLGFATLSQFVFVVVAGCFIVMQAVRYSHRVAGPAYRIVESLRQVRGGDLGLRIRLRGRDELTAVADEINVLLDWVEQNAPSGVSRELAAAEDANVAEGAEDAAAVGTGSPAGELHDH